MRVIFTEKTHFSSSFLSGLYCFTIWQAVPKYPSWVSVFPSPGIFHHGGILPHHDNEKQEKEELGTLIGTEDEGYLHPLSFLKFFFSFPQRWKSSLLSFVFSFWAGCYVMLLLSCLAKTAPKSVWGPLGKADLLRMVLPKEIYFQTKANGIKENCDT